MSGLWQHSDCYSLLPPQLPSEPVPEMHQGPEGAGLCIKHGSEGGEMISIPCEAAIKTSVKGYVDQPEVAHLTKLILKAHSKCQGAPGRGPFVCDCICHKPQGGG